MKEKDIPKWDTYLSYYDQEIPTLMFYLNEWEKITKGVTIGGVFIHPWLYFHCNFFLARISKPDGSEEVMIPPLDDNAWYFAENYMQAETEQRGLCMFGTRGFSKTVLEASISLWIAIIKANGFMSVNGGSAKDLKDVTTAIRIANENIHPFLRLPILSGEDWGKEVLFGFRETDSSTFHSKILIENHEGGKEGASEKGAGGTISGFIVDEIGKFDPRALLNANIPKFSSQYGAKLVHILAGTGGNEKLSEGAKYVLEHPAEFKLISMNWDRLDNMLPDLDLMTWKQSKSKPFCTFVPGQLSYRSGHPKQEGTLAELLKMPDNKPLKKIKIFKTDWEGATKKRKEVLDSLPAGESRNKEKMYFPLNTEDCFLTDSPNPFDVVKIQQKIFQIEQDPKYRLVDLYQDSDGSVKYRLSDKILAEREYKNKDVDSPLMMFGDDWDINPRKYEHVAGFDDYKTTTAKESKSLASMYILKRRNLSVGQHIETISMSYVARPHASHNILYENSRLALKAYGALCNIEAIDTGFASYLETLGFDIFEYLCRNLNPAQDLTSNVRKANSRYGTYPSPNNINIMLNAVIEYSREQVVVDFDDNNEPIVKTGIDFIEDTFLLKEMLDYTPGGNFDRIYSFGWALVYAQHLDKKNIQPKKKVEYKDEYYNETSRNIGKGNSYQKVGFQNFNTKIRYKNF